jgi:hypothetical protein
MATFDCKVLIKVDCETLLEPTLKVSVNTTDAL